MRFRRWARCALPTLRNCRPGLEPGSIRRDACFERCCSTAFAQQQRPVVMGPGVRRDDEKLKTHLRRLAARCVRVVPELSAQNKGRGECRVPDAPAAARGVVNTRVSHHGYTGSPGIPARNGFNGFLRALPGDRAFLPPSPLRSLLLKNLNASVEASGPHDFAVRFRRSRQKRHPRPPHPAPRS